MGEIRLGYVTKSFIGDPVIRDVSLTFSSGEFCVFVAPSGCGKSTLLRLIAGLEEVTSGRILMGDRYCIGEIGGKGVALLAVDQGEVPHSRYGGETPNQDTASFAPQRCQVRKNQH